LIKLEEVSYEKKQSRLMEDTAWFDGPKFRSQKSLEVLESCIWSYLVGHCDWDGFGTNGLSRIGLG
jgi:hypothetical protein